MVGVTIPRVSLRSTPGYEPLASLGHSTFQVVLRFFSGFAAVSKHHLLVMRLFAAVFGCGGIQPERLNAEGEARVLLAEGGALA